MILNGFFISYTAYLQCLLVDNEKVSAETAKYKKIPTIIDFHGDNGKDCMQEQIQLNYDKIKADVQTIIETEIARI